MNERMQIYVFFLIHVHTHYVAFIQSIKIVISKWEILWSYQE